MKWIFALTAALAFSPLALAEMESEKLHWARIAAKNSQERTALIEAGLSIEIVDEDSVVVLATEKELKTVQDQFNIMVNFEIGPMDYPAKDADFHNYAELTEALKKLAKENPKIVKLESVGKSLDKREIWGLTITSNQARHLDQAGIVFMGGHHAREHLSVEMPLLLAQTLVAKYKAGDERVKRYLDSRSIYIIPIVNPDGAEHDIANGSYRMWRKNTRKNSDGSMGVDLNRNYDHQWGTVGISHNPRSDVYCGPSAFSEPETQAMRDFFESHPNITIMQSYHTFSELILYPWGHTDQKIAKTEDYKVHSTMAQTMAQWNSYTPQQSSDLYLTSGDTSDWTYGTRGIVSFTFELDPASIFSGGFYPGQSYIQPVFKKNWEPALYLIEYTDNPYRVNEPEHAKWGLRTAVL